MFTTEDLNDLIDDYMTNCNNRPTRKGLSAWLHISTTTIRNVLCGYYGKNHTPYGTVPHISRKIANKDFEIVRSLFG